MDGVANEVESMDGCECSDGVIELEDWERCVVVGCWCMGGGVCWLVGCCGVFGCWCCCCCRAAD